MTAGFPVPANLDEGLLTTAMQAVREQESWCPKLKEIPHYELQTLLSIAIRAFLKARPSTHARASAAPVVKKSKGPARTTSKRARVLQRDRYTCYLCHLPITEADASIDHVIPKSKGGTHSLDNLRAAHKDCNFRKGDMMLDEYRALHPFTVEGELSTAERGEATP